ncbi:hypothetical protein AB0C38_31510 [Amycolatopsis sp. NPDC048633]|uniref:hypothetical protein n=1 Tax=Amycolatopsis sp. NPDC048633 TaxID=3157095 RepID=UPI0033FC3741
MTYPPQQPGPPYPPHGQYPQQGQYPGYPPQGYPPSGYPQYGGRPPKKGNGLLIGLIAGGVAFLLVVVFVITGFFAPGFLVSQNERPDGPAGNSPPLDLNSGSVVAGKFILAVFGDDATAGREAACASAEGVVASAVRTLGSRNAQLSAGPPIQAAANEIRVPLNGTIGSKSVHGELRVLRIQEKYCISEVTVPS